MSNAVFPSLPGLAFPVIKTPVFSSNIKRSAVGREKRRANMAAGLYRIGLQFNFLRDTAEFPEKNSLYEFFCSRKGSFDSFLFHDEDDWSVTGQPFGTGDGVTTVFQLVRTLGAVTEPVCNLHGTPTIYKAGIAQASGFSIGSSGLVTFLSAPALGDALIWSGQYYYRCRFLEDQQDYAKFMAQLWELKRCGFLGTLGDRI